MDTIKGKKPAMTQDHMPFDFQTNVLPTQSSFIGRYSELKVLSQLGEKVLAGLGQVVAILGETGIGKTRLITSWKEGFQDNDAQKSVYWVHAHITDSEKDLTYHLVKVLIKAILKQLDPDLTQINDNSIHQCLVEQYDLISPDEATDLAGLLEVSPSFKDEIGINPFPTEKLQSNYNNIIKDLLCELAKQKPIVIVLEDLQWADPLSIELLGEVLPLSTRYPILFSLVARKERRSSGWQLISSAHSLTNLNYKEMHLESLNEEESQELINQLTQSDPLPDDIIQYILEKSEGNPYFLTEFARMVLNDGLFSHTGINQSFANGDDLLMIPDSVQSILSGRLEWLDSQSRTLMMIASVIGRHFSLSLLESVIFEQFDHFPTKQCLNNLESIGLIHTDQVNPEIVYKFNHILLHQYVYNSIQAKLKSELHHAIALKLESMFSDGSDKFYSRLAEHFIRSNNPQKAVKCIIKAGKLALRDYAFKEAESYFTKAIEISHDQSDLAQLYTDLGSTQAHQSKHTNAIESWQKALPLHQSLGNTDQLARVYAYMARVTWGGLILDDRQKSLEICLAGLEAIKGAPESPAIAYLIHETSRSFAFNLQHDQAKTYAEKALKIAKELDAYDVQAEALSTIAILPTTEPEEAISLLHDAIDICETHQIPETGSRAYNNLSALTQQQNDFRLALEYRKKAISLSKNSSSSINPFMLMQERIAASLWLGDKEDIDKELTDLSHLIEGKKSIHDRNVLNMLILQSAYLRFKGDFSGASAYLKTLIERSKKLDDFTRWLEGLRSLIEISLEPYILDEEKPRPTKINTAINEINEVLNNSQNIPNQTMAAVECLKSILFALKGDLAEAEQALNLAQVILDSAASNIINLWQLSKINLPYLISTLHRPTFFMTTLTQARLEMVKTNYQKAIALYQKCIQTSNQHKGKWWEARLKLELGVAFLKRKDPEDIEQAQTIFREARIGFDEIKSDYYANLAIEKLRLVKQVYRHQAFAHKKLNQEINEAARIQHSLLPSQPPSIKGYQISSALLPAREMSGDFYDFFWFDENRLGIVIADVADKGAGAALYMAMSRTLFRTYAIEMQLPLIEVFQETNRRLLTDTPGGVFLTAFMGILESKSGLFQYVNAGHNPPYLLSEKNGQVDPKALEKTGPLLGIFMESTWTSSEFSFEPGHTLVLYTDGIPESQNRNKKYFGYRKFIASLKKSCGLSAEPFRNAILKNVLSFSGDAQRLDDITLTILKRNDH